MSSRYSLWHSVYSSLFSSCRRVNLNKTMRPRFGAWERLKRLSKAALGASSVKMMHCSSTNCAIGATQLGDLARGSDHRAQPSFQPRVPPCGRRWEALGA